MKPTTDERADREERTESLDRRLPKFLRRTILKAGTVAVGASALTGSATAHESVSEDDDRDGDGGDENGAVDQPEGFSTEVVAEHADFPDQVAAAFSVTFEDDGSELGLVGDASNLVIVKATLEPGGTTGWHTHPGPVVVSVVEGEVDIVFSDDCVTHTYAAGEAFIDTGNHDENATNPSDDEEAVLYAVFFGVPDGEPPLVSVEPADC